MPPPSRRWVLRFACVISRAMRACFPFISTPGPVREMDGGHKKHRGPPKRTPKMFRGDDPVEEVSPFSNVDLVASLGDATSGSI